MSKCLSLTILILFERALENNISEQPPVKFVMSDQRNSNAASLIGMAVAGGAVVGAAAYAAYEWFTNSHETPTDPPRNPPRNPPSPSACFICKNNVTAAGQIGIGLPCDHIFHENCLRANYILHMDEECYRCPGCGQPVPRVITNNFSV